MEYTLVDHRSRSGWNSGGKHGERCIGGLVSSGWGMGGVSPPQPIRESGERCELPKTYFGVFWRPQNAPFCTYMTKYDGIICISVPCSKFWGTCPPSPRDLRPRGRCPAYDAYLKDIIRTSSSAATRTGLRSASSRKYTWPHGCEP